MCDCITLLSKKGLFYVTKLVSGKSDHCRFISSQQNTEQSIKKVQYHWTYRYVTNYLSTIQISSSITCKWANRPKVYYTVKYIQVQK